MLPLLIAINSVWVTRVCIKRVMLAKKINYVFFTLMDC